MVELASSLSQNCLDKGIGEQLIKLLIHEELRIRVRNLGVYSNYYYLVAVVLAYEQPKLDC